MSLGLLWRSYAEQATALSMAVAAFLLTLSLGYPVLSVMRRPHLDCVVPITHDYDGSPGTRDIFTR